MGNATGFTTIFVLSFLFAGCAPQTPSVGINVTLLRRGPNPYPLYTDQDHLLRMVIKPKHMVQVRDESIFFEKLGTRLEVLFRTRAAKLLLVSTEGQVEFRDVIEALDRASSRVQLRYGFMTDHSSPTPDEPALFMKGKFIYTQYFLSPTVVPVPGLLNNLAHRGAFADAHFGTTKIIGSRTHRGRIYLRFGAPDRISDQKATVGPGDGFPLQWWTYRRLPGIGKNVLLTFVDFTLDGSYILIPPSVSGNAKKDRVAEREYRLIQEAIERNFNSNTTQGRSK